ncbi:MAG: DUF3300 domain-containing protein [Burkholderiaceae bacterium]
MRNSFFRWWRAFGFALVFLVPAIAGAQSADKPFSKEQLDQMLAQIALYPDPLLSQVLMAATYPDQFVAASAWSKAHPDAKGDAAVKSVEKEGWDPSVASLVAFPEVLITLGAQPAYVKNLGDAFLAQPDAVMDSIQRLRQSAQKAGNLKSNEQIKVVTQAPAPAAAAAQPAPTVIVIEPAQPSVVYVPAYNPASVYGPWWYPAYPPYYYPPPPGYWFSRTVATGIAFGIGIGVTNALWGGVNWGHNDVNINVNRYNNINVNNRIDVKNTNATWKHNPGNRKADYRGGDAARQQFDRDYQSSSRDQYRGRDGGADANRDASRARAEQSMQARGVPADKSSASDRARSIERDAGAAGASSRGDAARSSAPAAKTDRDAGRASAPVAKPADRDAGRPASQGTGRDNALTGANSNQARAQADRGAASRQAAARPAAGGGHAGGGGGGRHR